MFTKKSSREWIRVAVLLVVFLSGSMLPPGGTLVPRVSADSTPQTLPFSQNWSTTTLITADDNWSGPPGIVGFRGDDLGTTGTGTNPQTILLDGAATPVDVNANRSDPNTFGTGGVTEFDGIPNPVIALTGSGTADAPHIVISVNTTGLSGVRVAYNLRDIDASVDNAIQPVALQYRVGGAGSYTDLPAGFVADASSGPSLATLVTPVSVVLPAATDNQALVQVRMITTNAVGNDEWIGIDDILIFVPSDAKLDSFTANRYAGGKVLIEWHSGLEIDNLGFNVYREVNGKRVRVNSQILAGSALMAGERTNLKSGYSYAWADDPPANDAQYWLEAIDLNGQSTMFGPVSAGRAQTRDGLPPERGRALLLGAVGKSNRPIDPTAPITRAATTQITAEQLAAQSGIAARQAIKLSVKQEGWHRVTQPELIAAGLDQRIDPRSLRLYADGLEQAFVVKGEEDGRFDPQDAIEFYGIGLDTQATDTRVYWLAAGSEPGRRIEQVKGKGSRAAPSSSPYTVELKERTVYFSALRNGDKENFFGAVIARTPVDQMIRVEHLDTAVAGNATLEIALQGVTEVAHRVKVELNGTTAGEITFTGKKEGVAALAVPHAALKEGQNTVRLTPLGAESDVSLVSYIRITYPHTYTADNNALRFTLANKHQVTIDGFSSAAIRVLDITDPNEIHQVSARVQQQGEGYSVTVSAPKAGGGMLWALADDQARHVAAITPNQPSNLRDAENAADFVIVVHRDFMESVRPLQSLRESQGLKVTVVDVEDVYDEFGYGDKSPRAIKDFLAFAKTNWRTAPRFALFVGDASLDPKNYQGRGDYDFVPARFVDTLLMETVSDEWLADFDGDGLAEMALGRLPVRTAGEASRIIGKIVSYDSAPRSRDILLVSDLNDGIDFQSEFGQVRALVPDDVNVARIDRGALGTSAAKSELIESFNRGFGIVSYFGHGNVDQWRGDLLTSADAGALANGEMRPVVLAITCLNGYFQDPVLDSLAESLMKAERGGAVAVWASSGMCNAGPQAILDQELFRVIFARDESGGGALTLGEAVMRAKNSINDSDVRLTYVLFGDPTSRVK